MLWNLPDTHHSQAVETSEEYKFTDTQRQYNYFRKPTLCKTNLLKGHASWSMKGSLKRMVRKMF